MLRKTPPSEKWKTFLRNVLDWKLLTENTWRKTLDGKRLAENAWRKTLDEKHLTENTWRKTLDENIWLELHLYYVIGRAGHQGEKDIAGRRRL